MLWPNALSCSSSARVALGDSRWLTFIVTSPPGSLGGLSRRDLVMLRTAFAIASAGAGKTPTYGSFTRINCSARRFGGIRRAICANLLRFTSPPDFFHWQNNADENA